MTSTKSTKSARTTRKRAAAKPVTPIKAKPQTGETARDYATRIAEAALQRAAAVQSGAEKATTSLEHAAAGAIAGAARASRTIQTAIFDDAKATIVAFEHLVAARSLAEARRVQADYLRSRVDVNVARTKAVAAYAAGAANSAVKATQDNFAKLGAWSRKAA